MPLSSPIKGLDGREISEIPIPKNTNLIISALASNRDPDIWGSDSFEWIPERWMSASPLSVAGAPIPGVYSNLWVIRIIVALANTDSILGKYQDDIWGRWESLHVCVIPRFPRYFI